MNKQRPILLIALVLYVFSPSITQWITDIDGAWYRPFIIWLLVIAAAYFLQRKDSSHDV